MNNKFMLMAIAVGAVLVAVVAFVFLGVEVRKNSILKNENTKTIQEVSKELELNRVELKKTVDTHLAEKNSLQVLLEQMSKERDKAARDAAALEKRIVSEADVCEGTNEDLNKLRKELSQVRSERSQIAAKLETGFKKKSKSYETKILTLDSQLSKAKSRLRSEAERYHYNLGVIYTRNKDYEAAVEEFKAALGYNPHHAQAHYNLGIIYDDYFKDRERAKYHYRAFLELQPASDDAESVREWLEELS